jgi:hypothetical protein
VRSFNGTASGTGERALAEIRVKRSLGCVTVDRTANHSGETSMLSADRIVSSRLPRRDVLLLTSYRVGASGRGQWGRTRRNEILNLVHRTVADATWTPLIVVLKRQDLLFANIDRLENSGTVRTDRGPAVEGPEMHTGPEPLQDETQPRNAGLRGFSDRQSACRARRIKLRAHRQVRGSATPES